MATVETQSNDTVLQNYIKYVFLSSMKTADSTTVVRSFHRYLNMVEHGESIQIRKHGRAVARLVPDRDFMPGKMAADLFRSHRADKLERATAKAIAEQIAILDRESEDALAH